MGLRIPSTSMSSVGYFPQTKPLQRAQCFCRHIVFSAWAQVRRGLQTSSSRDVCTLPLKCTRLCLGKRGTYGLLTFSALDAIPGLHSQVNLWQLFASILTCYVLIAKLFSHCRIWVLTEEVISTLDTDLYKCLLTLLGGQGFNSPSSPLLTIP